MSMGLYIKNMDMPTVGRILITFPSGRTLEVSADNTQNILGEAKAIPVPPHGDLIERDALEQECQKRLLVCTDQFQRPYEVMRAIALAPTVMPAEEAE